jgi:Fe-S-cluster containining protein
MVESSRNAASALHPCQRCGACCAKWRVQFYWREAERGDSVHPVPPGLFEELDDTHRTMRGTTAKHRPRCVALAGRIGEDVGCKVYENRPSPCRAFQASFENGVKNPRCDEARAAHGLRPLTSGDWPVAAKSDICGRQPKTSAPVTG